MNLQDLIAQYRANPDRRYSGAVIAEDIEEVLATDRDSRSRMLSALVLADGSLTWCRARHQQGNEDVVLTNAIEAVHQFTRRKP